MSYREPMPTERQGRTAKMEIEGRQEGYIIANLDGRRDPREIFLHGFGKEGSTMDGWANAFAMLFSIGLQTGGDAFFEAVTSKLQEMNFEPRGKTNDPDIPVCTSIPDYIAKKLVIWFC